MMGYKEWFAQQGKLHGEVVEKLKTKGYDKEQIIDYFDFDNMVKNEPNFCPLYKDNKKCHDLDKLNCFLCACPYFRFNDKGFEKREDKILYSYCSIDSKKGKTGEYGKALHHDCSKCVVPHKRNFVAKNYNEDWFVPMKECDLSDS
jgi:hypothetical protein